MRDVKSLVILEGKFPLVVLSLCATYQLSLRADPGEGPGVPPPLFLDQTKNFFGDRTLPPPPLYLRVWMTGPPPYLKVWIRHCHEPVSFTKHLFPCCGLLCM